jgi:Anti-sigma factor NepR
VIVSTTNINTSTVLEEPDTLQNLRNVDGDPGPEPTLPPHVAAFLGEQLQGFYAHLMNEPVPDRFVQLLAQLDGKRSGQDGE